MSEEVQPRVIKKYPNRRLYDTEESKYITLQQIRDLVLAEVPLIHLDDRTPDPDWVDWPRWADTFGLDLGDLPRGPTFSHFNSGLRAAVAGQGLVLCGIVEAFGGQLAKEFPADRTGEIACPLLLEGDTRAGGPQDFSGHLRDNAVHDLEVDVDL